jgi:hypothetical protein
LHVSGKSDGLDVDKTPIKNRDGRISDRLFYQTKGKGEAPAGSLPPGFKAEDDSAVDRLDDCRGGDLGRDLDQRLNRGGRVGD